MLKAAMYIRVSDERQLSGHSLKEQEPMLRELASSKGYKVVRVFKDAAKSATTIKGRDGLIDALVFLDENPDVTALFVQDTDRLARNTADHALLKREFKKLGVKLISKNQPMTEGDSPEEELSDEMIAAINQYLSRQISRKVRQVSQRLTAQGKTMGLAPIGFKNINTGTEMNPNKIIIKDPLKAALVKEAFELYATGNYSLNEIGAKLFEKGLTGRKNNQLHSSTLQSMMRNQYYLGKVQHKGTWYDGLHDRLISDTLFDQCQRMLEQKRNFASRSRNKANKDKFFLKEFLRGGEARYKMSGENVGGRSKQYSYYHCPNPEHSKAIGGCAKLKVIEGQVEGIMSLISLSENVVSEVTERAAQILHETHTEVDDEQKSIRKKLDDHEKHRQILEIKLLDAVVDDDTYNRQHDRINSDIAKAQKRLSQIEDGRVIKTEAFEAFVALARNLKNAYSDSTPAVKRMYLNVFFEVFIVENGEVKKAIPTKAVQALHTEGLLKFTATNEKERFLIRKIWYPGQESNL